MKRCLLVVLLMVGCGPSQPGPDIAPDTSFEDAGNDAAVAIGCPTPLDLQPVDAQSVAGEGHCDLTFTIPAPTLVELIAPADSTFEFGEEPLDEPNWVSPRVLDAGTYTLGLVSEDAWVVELHAHGPPVEVVERDRSLVWTDGPLLDDPAVVGLGRLMDAAADGGNGGNLFAGWLRRFATTAHSERVGPLQLLEEIEGSHGSDPATWDLDALDFTVTAVHNRTDLARGDSCGELRVSVASTHPIFQPFHAIFLFAQPAAAGDVSPGGRVHCGGTLRRWAFLSELEETEFRNQARQLLAEALQSERFLMVETVEFIISPWEWRQWLPTPSSEPGANPALTLENPPLFQTVDTARLNAPGTARDAFLQFVEENASALDARQVLVPDRFRVESARVNAGVPWVPLDLGGVDPAVLGAFPNLRQNIEIIGCPACHATDADFIQTRVDRTFSPFYDKELDARASHLGAAHRGLGPAAPYGPLQPSPVLPP